MRRSILTTTVVLMGVIAPAQADIIIYDRGPDSNLSVAWSSNVGGPYITYNAFSLLPGQTTIDEILWWGSYAAPASGPPVSDDFTIQIVGDDNGLPDLTGTLFLDFDAGNNVNRTEKVGDDFLSLPTYGYQSSIAPLTLSPNTTYWLTVINDTNPAWVWLESSNATLSTAPFEVVGNGLEFWGRLDISRAFQLAGPSSPLVPEPGTMTLLGIGLAALGYRRFRSTAE